MSEEETAQTLLQDQFPFLAGKISIQRARRIWAEVPAESVRQVFDFAVDRLKFNQLCTITGLDEGENLAVIYHLAREIGATLNLHTVVPKANPVLYTVSDRFPAADCYERELVDLLGFKVEGLPPGHRYPLPDNWPAGQFPLRKDWDAAILEGIPDKESDNA
ncbi:MAG: NADH-quinone oxidoreductase subunit C [Phycisphaerae bacterium]|jgi:Ni,Fe-hydrogenase III component G